MNLALSIAILMISMLVGDYIGSSFFLKEKRGVKLLISIPLFMIGFFFEYAPDSIFLRQIASPIILGFAFGMISETDGVRKIMRLKNRKR